MLKQTLFLIYFFTLFTFHFSQAQTRLFDVRDYGATGRKSEKATAAIQRAIDACAETGGGTVYFPPGEYLSGTVRLKDHVNLHLENGARWYASQDTADYQVPYNIYKGNNPSQPVLIYAEEVNNIGISGQGLIDGQARREYDDLRGVDSFIAEETELARASGVEMKMYYKIPPIMSLIYFVDCKDVKIKDVHIRESSSWTLHVQWCERVEISGILLESSLEQGVNADGIDVDGCRDVLISNCIIKTGDDAIVLKSTLTNGRFENCENVTVTNCVLTSTSSALKIGTETFGDFQNIVFSNCTIEDTNRGLGIIVRDGGTVSDVVFSNISMQLDRKHFNWWGDADPIWLVILKRTPESKVGKIENILFENIIAHGQGSSRLEGFAGQPLRNISLSNVQLFMHPEDTPDKRATHALIASDVQDISLHGLSVYWDEARPEDRWQSAVSMENVDGLIIADFKGRQALRTASDPVISLRNVGNAVIRDAEATEAVPAFIRVSGADTRKIAITDVDLLGRARQKVAVAPGTPLEEILLK
ncbi:MAG: glycoside hydrolase family 28 protein [Cyclobacteriaceae bacterium]